MAAKDELPSLTLVQLYQDAIICSRVTVLAQLAVELWVTDGATTISEGEQMVDTLNITGTIWLSPCLNAFFHRGQKLLINQKQT